MRLAVLAGLAFAFALVAPSTAATLTIGPDSPTSMGAGRAVSVLPDPSGTITFDQARRMVGRFAAPPKPRAQPLPFRDWMRADIASTFDLDRRLAVALPWDRAEYYLVRGDGAITAFVGGLDQPIHDRSGAMTSWELRNAVTPEERMAGSAFSTFVLRAGERATLFIHVGTLGRFARPTFDPILSVFDDQLERGRFRLYVSGIIVGILFALCIYSLVVFFSTRDASYCWYAGYLCAIGASFAGQYGPGTSLLMQFALPEHPFAAVLVKRLADPVAWVAFVFFTRAFFQTRSRWPRWDAALLAMAAIITVYYSLYLGGITHAEYILWVYAATSVLCVATGILAYLRGYRAPYFVVGQGIVLFSSFSATLSVEGIQIFGFLPDSGILGSLRGTTILFAAAALEGLIFSVALADRLQRMRDDVARANADKAADERLLHNMLPVSIADELKRTGVSEPRRFEEVTILFTDLKDFTTAAGLMPAKKLVGELDELFRAFDDIVETHGLEKIKTIGDAYMAAAGIPLESGDHAVRCTRAALAMLRFVEERNARSSVKWRMRAGMHSGSVIAGVVGKHKFVYDVWGDTVNIASRIESNGEAGTVSMSAYTHDLVKEAFACDYRGKIALKGKGEIDFYSTAAVPTQSAVASTATAR